MFTDAYAGYSVCAPSRMSLMTGYHSGHIGSSNLEPLLNTSYTTMPDVLRKAGYKTALIGKWGDRLIPKHVKRFYGTLSAKGALPRSRDDRIQRLWEAIRAWA